MALQEAMLNHRPAGQPSDRQKRAQVLYDGDCLLCRRSVRLLKRLDWLHRLDYVNARDWHPQPVHLSPLDPSRLLEEMHLVTPGGGRVYHGFRAFRWMAWHLPLLWPLVPFLYLPGVAAVGQRIYLWVARNRFHLVPCHDGVCTLPQRLSRTTAKLPNR
jgi:predicted DCC family thiol-disulfide oxidoreductase YuxK